MNLIAVIDDNVENFEVLSEIIKMETSEYNQADFPKSVEFAFFTSYEEFLRFDKHEKIQMILLDYFLSQETGEKVCQKIKSLDQFKNIPVIFVSGSGFVNERVIAFESGASDFVTRPFNHKELFFRIKVHWPEKNRKGNHQFGNLLFDNKRNLFRLNEKDLKLTQKEYLLLKLLFDNYQRIVYRDEIKTHIWGVIDVASGNIDTQIYNLKKKLEGFDGEIRTFNRIGFRLVLKEKNLDR
jgi:two-component system alkaline phosphatase synthesis response regulator PhoP